MIRSIARGLAAALLALTMTTVCTASANATTPSTSTVASGIQAQANSNLGNPHSIWYDPGVHVTSAVCHQTSPSQMVCDVHVSDGRPTVVGIVNVNGGGWYVASESDY